jgi:glycosyltransferase involved in cell wall biosynthesis
MSSLKLEDHVHFHGLIPFDDMIKMIAKSDVGIVPVEKNPYSDLVHTNKMFEYIAMKKPVILSRIKAVEDFFGSDDSCLKYFESGDEKDLARCILELYNSPEKEKKW